MKNLAGSKERTHCDQEIELELERAGITAVKVPQNLGEVEYSLIGELDTEYGKMIFRRAWYYWMVECKVPLEIAKRIYSHPEGKVTVRAGGHCGCMPPENEATYYKDGKISCSKKEYESGLKIFGTPGRESIYNSWVNEYTPVDNPKECEGFVTCYHIDDQAGLLLFVLVVTGKLKGEL